MTSLEVWDTHLHVIGDPGAFQLAPTRSYDPPSAPIEALLAHLDRLGIDRGVIVQPSVYGFDNACLIDALERSDGRCRGIAVPPPDADFAALASLHRAGVRGIRCNLLNPGGLPLETTEAWWPWMVDHRWHLQLQIDASRTDPSTFGLPEGLRVVVDHMGYPPPGTRASALASLRDAVAWGAAHVKLSAPYRISAEPPPHNDAQALAQTFLTADPSLCLFATDWPHTEMTEPPMADEIWLSTIRDLAGTDWSKLCAAAADLYA